VDDMAKRKNNYHNAKTSRDYLSYEVSQPDVSD
jgi:hypothetical protein